MNTPFPSRFAFAVHPVRQTTDQRVTVRAALFGLSLFALVAASVLVAG